MSKDDVSSFLRHLNGIELSIQFTCERESDDCSLPFLDIHLQRNSDGTISTKVYRKPTHTDRYLDFSSHHPLTHKIKTLFSRAHSLSSSVANMLEEQEKVSKALESNNYPGKFVDRVYRRVPQAPVTDQRVNHSIVIPYIRGLSEAIKRVFSPVRVRVLFRPHSTLRQQLFHVKDPTPVLQMANVVYSIPCTTCSATYIGQTGRLLSTRLDEHKAAVRLAKCDTSAVAEHIWKHQHRMDFQSTSVLVQERNLHQRCSLESWHIRKSSTINRENGSLASIYSVVF